MFNTIEEALEDIKKGKMIIVVDSVDRENEGDFLMAAEFATPLAINFMAKYGRGLICAPIEKTKAKDLGLELMIQNNDSPYETAFTVTIDLKKGLTTGISAKERSNTIMALANSESIADDFVKPGHIFPLIAHSGGVLKRAGHTEAAVDLSRLAGLQPAGVICEILNDDGTMARRDDLFILAKKFDLKMITIEDLIEYKQNNFEHIAFFNKNFNEQTNHITE